MAGRTALMVTEQEAELLRRLCRRRTVAMGGICAYETPDALTLTLCGRNWSEGGEEATAGSSWVWARVTSVQEHTFTARLIATDGTVYGDPITVHVWAATTNGLTIEPTLAWLVPHLDGQDVKVERRLSGYRSAASDPPMEWWLLPPALESC